LLEDSCAPALFGTLIEGLADRFEPALCDCYALLMAPAIAAAIGERDPDRLLARYARVRCARPVSGAPTRVAVLSRITLGADVAVTSVLLDAARRRFPAAEILFLGPRKNFELFAAGDGITHVPVEYKRGSLAARIAVRTSLLEATADADCLVLDPDSRLTQLGLLPIAEEGRYHLFESRAWGGEDSRSLSELAASWCEVTLGVSGCRPCLALAPAADARGAIAISLGVGENPVKRLPEPFEERLFALLSATGAPLYIDRGAGGEEAARVERAAARAGVKATFWEGSFAGFASIIAASRLYVGYDSAGQHVAAACGIPLISIFAGFPTRRMFDRWAPRGPHCQVIRVDKPDVERVLAEVGVALSR
jgi:hypothetical protein